jgi:hypothetical protein
MAINPCTCLGFWKLVPPLLEPGRTLNSMTQVNLCSLPKKSTFFGVLWQLHHHLLTPCSTTHRKGPIRMISCTIMQALLAILHRICWVQHPRRYNNYQCNSSCLVWSSMEPMQCTCPYKTSGTFMHHRRAMLPLQTFSAHHQAMKLAQVVVACGGTISMVGTCEVLRALKTW